MELISCKMLAAESEYELEELRGKVSRMGKQLKRLGCVEHSSFEQAKLTTSMEVRLAQALSESAELRAANAALHEDVKGLIELKVELAELKTQAAGKTKD